MTDAKRCGACGRKNSEAARFCRRCGVALAAVTAEAALDAGDAVRAERVEPSSAPPFDDQRLFRELCWLCGLPIAVSIALSIYARFVSLTALSAFLAVAAMCVIAVVGAALNPRLVRSGLRWPKARELLATIGVAAVLGPALVAAFVALESLGFRFHTEYLAPYVADGWPPWMAFVDLALLTPVAEELLFRGVIQPKLEQVIAPNEALVVQAALFSALHLSPLVLVTHFMMGLAFGWLRRRSGSLLPGMLMHGAWNAFVLATSPG